MFHLPNRISIGVLFVAFCSVSAAPGEGQDAAIAAIQKLGGKVEYNDSRKSVSLRDLKITDADLKHLKELPDLTDLELRGTAVTDSGLAHLKDLNKLVILNLYDTTIGDAGLEHLKGLTKLNFLMLKQTNVTDAGARKLKQALPDCETISHSPRTPPPLPATFVGKWSIEFANGVKETCEIRADGTASVVEPRRNSKGLAAFQGKALVVAFEDDRVERWSLVGKRMVVEHWAQSNPLWAGHPPLRPVPTSAPILGIAERAP